MDAKYGPEGEKKTIKIYTYWKILPFSWFSSVSSVVKICFHESRRQKMAVRALRLGRMIEYRSCSNLLSLNVHKQKVLRKKGENFKKLHITAPFF